MEKKIVNLTGHNVRIYVEGWEKIDIEPLVDENWTTIRFLIPYLPRITGKINEKIPVGQYDFLIDKKKLMNICPEKEDTIYIVSSVVAQKLPERKDFYIVGEVVKDPMTKAIIGAKMLVQNPFGKQD